tara:strand:- start:1604 stop:2362 length:759 start_codon:yes stop_codon:yes gene_type:complete
LSLKTPDFKVFVVVLAYNAQKTIKNVIDEIPFEWVDKIIISDDDSTDKTYDLSKTISGVEVIKNKNNLHMGGNQKVVYNHAIENDADIVVVLHGDNQYDASKIPDMIKPIIDSEADVVIGSRILGGMALKGGMPKYKYMGNIFLNFIQNTAFKLKLSDYATGYKAYSRKVLTTIPYLKNRNDFIFDEQLNTQIVFFGFRILQIGIPTRYFNEASSVNFLTSVHYGLWTVITTLQFILAKNKIFTPNFLSKLA